MKHEIKHRHTGAVLFAADCESPRECAALAVKAGADLQSAYLRSAYLRSADLQGADLRSADLRSAYLRGADLRGADLQGADLRSADLQGADLRSADLRSAYLRGADLQNAYLQGADLRGADLQNAYLQGADLRSADLRSAYLRGADLRSAKNIPAVAAAQTSICAEGTLRVYKKTQQGIVVLEIPAQAARSNATGRKCRAEYAVVLETPNGEPAYSTHDPKFAYRPGETVRPDRWDPDRWNECGGGIHFFLTREEAEAY